MDKIDILRSAIKATISNGIRTGMLNDFRHILREIEKGREEDIQR